MLAGRIDAREEEEEEGLRLQNENVLLPHYSFPLMKRLIKNATSDVLELQHHHHHHLHLDVINFVGSHEEARAQMRLHDLNCAVLFLFHLAQSV